VLKTCTVQSINVLYIFFFFFIPVLCELRLTTSIE